RLFLYVLQLGFIATYWSRDSNIRVRYIFILVLTIGYDVQNRLHQFCDLQLAPIWMGITLGTSSQGSRNVSNWKVHKQFIIAEIFLILNFLNILRVYLRLGQKMNHSRSNLSRL